MDNTLKKSLKAQAHHLNPVILMGSKGLTDAVIAESDIALSSHELIKIKIVASDKKERLSIIQSLSEAVHATIIQVIGHIAVLYRQNPDA